MVFNRNPYYDYKLVTSANETLKTARGQYYAKSMLAALIPPYGAYLRTRDAMQDMDHTLELYGLGYEDIDLITNTKGFNAAGGLAPTTLNFVSSNLRKLYK